MRNDTMSNTDVVGITLCTASYTLASILLIKGEAKNVNLRL